MSERRRNDGGHGKQPEAAPRVRGAWKTPAVVVRAPDGSVVDRGSSTRRRRIPPPGVTGGALATPTRPVAGGNGNRSASARAPRNVSRRSPRLAEPRRWRVISNLRLDRLAPIDEAARGRRNARLRWLGTRVGTVALTGLLVYAVFPVRTYLSQRSDTNRAREQLEVLSEENERLEQRADELRDPDTVEEIARRDHNLVMPGEESYGIMPPPEQAPEGDNLSEPAG
ncbi:MAG: FtsB family cell division protein [Acidimicrobiales bacterium]